MPHKITSNLFFDDINGCKSASLNMAVVHACKEPCHRNAIGYSEKSLSNSHPNYLTYQRGFHLYLNMVDPPVPLFKKESFDALFNFIDEQIKSRPVLIHCNKGESRAPSIAMLYAAKRLNQFPNDSYATARAAFEKRFPYKPGLGIEKFLTDHWALLG